MKTRSDSIGIAPLAWPRAIAFGIVAGGMGVLGHDLVAKSPTQPWVLACGVLFAMLVARPLAPLRIGAKTMLAGLALLQTVIHLTCIAMVDAVPGTAGAAGAMHHHASMVMPGNDLTSGGWPMLLAHAVSLLLGAAVLLTLERHAWAGVREIADRVVRAVTGLRARRRVRAAAADLRFGIRSAQPRAGARRDLTGSIGLRGPPAYVLTPQ